MAAEEGSEIIKDSMDQAENPYHTTVTCTAGKLIEQLNIFCHAECITKLNYTYP